jgi:hypothetical protein
VRELTEDTNMTHVTDAEIFGREEGRKEGFKEGLKEMVREALVVRFHKEGAALAEDFEGEQRVDRLRLLHRLAILAESPSDFRACFLIALFRRAQP